jgi:hypothetical protein
MIRPTKEENEFLNISYQRFASVAKEILSEGFFNNKDTYRYYRIKTLFEVYSEIANYPPIKSILKYYELKNIKKGEIAKDLFSFVRNLLSHFPFFENWNEVWIKKSLVNWQKPGLTIDKFLKENQGKKSINFHMTWNNSSSIVTVNYPQVYDDSTKIWLKDILSEKEGIRFSVLIMKEILDTQWSNT